MQHSGFLLLANLVQHHQNYPAATESWLGGAERTGSKFDFCPGTSWLGGGLSGCQECGLNCGWWWPTSGLTVGLAPYHLGAQGVMWLG